MIVASFFFFKDSAVEVQKLGGVTLIGLNRPERRNAVDPPTATLLYKAFKEFDNDTNAGVAVLYGKHGNFSAGFDLKTLSEGDLRHVDTEPNESDKGPMGPTRLQLSKPVIAAISGYAVAGGLELSLIADIRVVEESAKMGIFCRRFGVPLIDGGTVRLPHLIGLSRALDLILTGREIDAHEAHQFGLANRVVPTGKGLDEAIKLAETLLNFPQKCMNRDRKSAYNAMFDAKSFKDAMQYEFKHGMEIIREESIPGAKRFSKGAGRHGNFRDIGDPKSKL
ncbi:hypothetical protein FSP39_015874 [Pinctada imbricata]|uniref:Enoyl-CoA hydratase n=1 Tax=Pinctada imbricata TaxID=66713 RepID=A0AA89BUU8_PINIB|nr:hypothetical protein FSP39_015874 [Pinctada imbricata]